MVSRYACPESEFQENGFGWVEQMMCIMLLWCNGPMYCIVIITVNSRHATAGDQAEQVNMFYL